MTDYQTLSADYLALWNETDADARATAAAGLVTDDVAYTDPMADVRGRDGLSATIAAVQGQFPGWRFRPAGTVDGHGDQLRFSWELGPDDAAAPVAGFDVAVLAPDGRIRQILGFLDRVPA